uniref:Endonuclease/exonuclease/phosphatase domain-containing protein n=1 Tax=Auxenochlorella protothecoides TaxID=3075 RepID=A0A1D2A2B6_AUXPR
MGERLPSPGSIIQRDYRDLQTPTPHRSETLRLLQWNIERGYKLPGIIEELKQIDADVIALQEVDIGCERSGSLDTGNEIAKALGLNYAFFCEFEELRSPLRTPELQGGGVHGNAILSKFDILDLGLVQHSVHPVDWNKAEEPRARLEPRRGERAVLRARIAAPGTNLVVYCAHLEVFCGALVRMRHLADIFNDARSQIDQGYPRIAILGDMNTMAHGVARLSPSYCCDRMRFRFLGSTEGEVWQDKILSVPDPRYSEPHATDALAPNPHVLAWGLPPQVALGALNPGFSDPFDARNTVTLDNPKYRWGPWSLMAGKLDWMMLRQLTVHSTSLGNQGYELSDHAWLCADVSV